MSAAARSTDPRRAELGKIHIGKKALGLDDTTYRGLLHSVTGKSSAGDLDPGERRQVLDEMQRRGFEPEPRGHGRGRRKRPSKAALHPQAAKARALWLSLWNLGEVRDPSEAAMDAFVSRQSGIDAAAWMRDPADARKVIEALKDWCARAGVRFGKDYPDRLAVIEAQVRKLGCSLPLNAKEATVLFSRLVCAPVNSAEHSSAFEAWRAYDQERLDEDIRTLGAQIRDVSR